MSKQDPNKLRAPEALDPGVYTPADQAFDGYLTDLLGTDDASVPAGLSSRVFAASAEHLAAPQPMSIETAGSGMGWNLRTVGSRVAMAACFALACTVLFWTANQAQPPMQPGTGGPLDAVPSVADHRMVDAGGSMVDVSFGVAQVSYPTVIDVSLLDADEYLLHETDRLLDLKHIGYDSVFGELSVMLGEIDSQEM